MKKILLYIFLPIVAGGMFSSCADYLDVDKYFYDQLSIDSAFSKRKYVDGWLSNAFEPIQYITEGEGMRRWMSDDIVKYEGRDYQNGNYSATTNNGDSENLLYKAYEAVRKASTFIDNVDRCGELTEVEKADMKGQMRFIRAYAYWSLIRHFGPVPLIPEHGLDVSLSYEELSLPRASLDEIVAFIDQDLVVAARSLPMVRTVNNMGRPTRGAALALRARILLWVASPLMNGNRDLFNVKDNRGRQLVPQEYDESKWAKAAAAAKEVMDLGIYELYTIEPSPDTPEYERPPYNAEFSDKNFPDGWADVDPYLSYKSIFDGTIIGSKNPELIFTRTSRGNEQINHWVSNCMPRTLSGSNLIGVSQKQVDAYYMDNGQTIQEAEASGYYKEDGFTTSSNPLNEGGAPFLPANVSWQYAHREPRFYASIAYCGSIWACSSANEAQYRNKQIFYYRDLNDGKQGFKEDCPLTGIGFKKFVNDEDAFTQGGYRMDKTENTIRYAEMLLIYAEALNELTPGKSYTVERYNGETMTVQRDVNEMRSAMKPIRMRAGVPDFDDVIYANQELFRTALKRERQIELVGENCFRYYDLRRWKDALLEENQPLMGCNINISDDVTRVQEFYRPTVVASMPKVFTQRMYLWPFPDKEMKRNVNLTQNPGW
ncbi:RagB/SusD family nutrient uptake outer membrane protein [Leyella lascolaii]|uniref:RagB/SusD family nutrient uptake outer membrane protein n=1 Tax=Leyella lascolaii TaxID=1776379 RepID=A0AAW7JRQ5_9BACT|nr:RagB/SusD family nutrient uptake outer membrane protein [Leyella lascolaii]MDN0021425.1 RagB/SusD family nutrient uptake outer membrane protein [Leyella lascolaii]MDN0023922.1 RagB/SusD family nutrient uptake outer membrane protein [Leyella lascolaii]